LTILTRDGSAGFAQKIEGRGSTSGTDWQPLVTPACLLSRACCRSSDLPPGSRAQPRRVGLNYQRSSDFARFSRSSFTQFLLLLSSRLHTRLSGPKGGRSTWGWVTGTIKADKIRRVVGGVRCRGEVAWQGWLDAMRCDVGETRGRESAERERKKEASRTGWGWRRFCIIKPPPGTHGVGEGGAQGGASKAVAVSLSQARFTVRSPSRNRSPSFRRPARFGSQTGRECSH
jgi:hypothetical protein